MSLSPATPAGPGTAADPATTERSVWRDHTLALYATAQFCSTAGSSVSTVALPIVAAITLHASTFQVSVIATAGRLPPLVLALPIGAVIDRYAKRRILLACEAGAGLVMLSIPLAGAAWGTPPLWLLVAVAFLVSVLSLIGSTASISYVPEIVPPAQLVDANAGLSCGNSAATLAGSNLGAGLVTLLGAAAAVLADSLSYLISFVLLWAIPRATNASPPHAQRPQGKLRGEVREGLAFVWRQPLVRAGVITNGCYAAGMAASSALFALFLLRDLHATPAALGLILSIGSCGGILGGLASKHISARFSPGRLVLSCTIAAVPCQLALVAAPPGLTGQALIAGALLVQAACTVATGSVVRSIRQTVTPPALQARAQAASSWISFSLRPAAALTAGAVATVIGLRPTLGLTALPLAAAAVALLASPLPALRCLPKPDLAAG